MSNLNFKRTAYGKNQPLIDVFNDPIISLRAPTVNDKAPLGQLWIDKTTNRVWTSTSFVNGNTIWTELDNNAANNIVWSTVAGAAIDLDPQHGYYLTDPTVITCTLPANANLGAEIWLITQNSTALNAGLILAQRVGQQIRYDQYSTTAGVGGSLSWLNQGNNATPYQLAIHLICTEANTVWSLVYSNRNRSAIV